MRQILVASVAILSAAACSDATAPAPSFSIDLYGWQAGASGTDGQYVKNLREYDPQTVEALEVQLAKPATGRVLQRESFGIGTEAGDVPDLSFGDGLRMEFALKGADGERVAAGATPTFDIGPDARDRGFEVMLVPDSGFGPVGGRYRDRNTGQIEYRETFFDQRVNGSEDQGRAGHRLAAAGDGRAVIVGGAQIEAGRAPWKVPKIEKVFDDVQRFDVNSGYTTDLGWNPREGVPRPGNQGRLSTPRAYHTVSHLGDQLFAVVGGYTRDGSNVVPTRSIEFVDLGREPGRRVFRASNADGNALQLNSARAEHTATYLPDSERLVVAGGVGTDGEAEESIEVVDLNQSVVRQPATLAQGRVEHAAVRMDETEGVAIWIIGGRADGNRVPLTEFVKDGADGLTSESAPDLTLTPGRYDFGATRLTAGPGGRVAICGGYFAVKEDEQTEDNRISDCRIGDIGLGEWKQPWAIDSMRGGAHLFELEYSGDLALVGGMAANGQPVGSATRMVRRGGEGTRSTFELTETPDEMFRPRFETGTMMLGNGSIFITGGIGPSDGSLSEATDLTYYNAGDIAQSE